MYINLYAAAINVKLLRLICGFNCGLFGLNLGFENESAHKLEINFNLNVDF